MLKDSSMLYENDSEFVYDTLVYDTQFLITSKT